MRKGDGTCLCAMRERRGRWRGGYPIEEGELGSDVGNRGDGDCRGEPDHDEAEGCVGGGGSSRLLCMMETAFTVYYRIFFLFYSFPCGEVSFDESLE
jgi:hypothetical protein